MDGKELEEELAKMEREMEADSPQTGNMKRCHEVTRAMIAAARAGIKHEQQGDKVTLPVVPRDIQGNVIKGMKYEVSRPREGGRLVVDGIRIPWGGKVIRIGERLKVFTATGEVVHDSHPEQSDDDWQDEELRRLAGGGGV